MEGVSREGRGGGGGGDVQMVLVVDRLQSVASSLISLPAVCNYCARSQRFTAAGHENKPVELWLSGDAVANKGSTEFKQLSASPRIERTKLISSQSGPRGKGTRSFFFILAFTLSVRGLLRTIAAVDYR